MINRVVLFWFRPKVKDWTLPASYKIYQNIKHEAVNLSTLCQASLKGAQYIKEKLAGTKTN